MKFRLGINYWPVSSAMYWWLRFDSDEVRRDFSLIAGAGFDSVRVFLLWETFQPAVNRVSDRALQRLVTVADAASRAGLSLVPTFFTGHMSGVNWIPEWALDPCEESSRFPIVSGGKVVRARPKNWYADPSILKAQSLLVREVARALGDHPALWAYDLGNENSNCVVPPSRESAIAWLEQMAGEIRAVDSTHAITMGLHMEDLEEDRNLGPVEAGRVCDFLCMHGYPIYADWAESETDAMLLPFLGMITRWLSGRDVLFEEFGAPAVNQQVPAQATLLSEQHAAKFTRDALEALHRFGFLGAMVWCFGDYAKWLWSWPPLDRAVHERYFGVWRNDHSAKPAIAEIKRFEATDRLQPSDDFSWIDILPSEYYSNPHENLRRLYRRFRQVQADYSLATSTRLS
jgi:endo-1,4-beta-mannosidase